MMSTKNVILTALIMVFGGSAFAQDSTWGTMFGYDSNIKERPANRRAVRPQRKAKATKKVVAKKKETTKVASKPVKSKPVVAKKPTGKAPEVAELDQEQDEAQAPAKTGKVTVTNEALKGQLARFSHVDPKNQIAEEPLKRALAFYAMNQHKISNSRYMGVIDFTKNSSKPRFCIIEMKSGSTECIKTSHGIGSDGGGGWARKFSNRNKSHASSVGYYKTLSTYSGKHGTSLRMDGLSATNSNALRRAVVIHGARYVNDNNRAISGRSHGCPAVDDARAGKVISKLKGGALIYAWHPKHMSDPSL